MEHALAYTSLSNGTLDVTDVYTTDAAIRQRDLVVLADDRHFFPSYEAIVLYRADLDRRAPQVVDVLLRLEGTINEAAMIEMNAASAPSGNRRASRRSFCESMKVSVEVKDESLTERELRWTWRHLVLVVVSLALAIVVAVPLGIAAARTGRARLICAGVHRHRADHPGPGPARFAAGVLRSIGAAPAIVALFCTVCCPSSATRTRDCTTSPYHCVNRPSAGFVAVAAPLSHRVAAGLAVHPGRYQDGGGHQRRLCHAGRPHRRGRLRRADHGRRHAHDYRLILEGAIPAVVMALLVQALFEMIERVIVPKGLRLRMSV